MGLVLWMGASYNSKQWSIEIKQLLWWDNQNCLPKFRSWGSWGRMPEELPWENSAALSFSWFFCRKFYSSTFYKGENKDVRQVGSLARNWNVTRYLFRIHFVCTKISRHFSCQFVCARQIISRTNQICCPNATPYHDFYF